MVFGTALKCILHLSQTNHCYVGSYNNNNNNSNNNNVSYFYSANWHMNMMKCALKFWRKSNQHCPNHYFAIIIHKSNQIKSKLMSNFGF